MENSGRNGKDMVSIDEIKAALLALEVDPSDEIAADAHSNLNFRLFCMDAPRVDEVGDLRPQQIESCVRDRLLFAGVIVAKGDCPVCHCSGHVALPMHAECIKTMYKKAAHRCGCGAKAQTIYNWRASCYECQEHQEHLDMLCD